VQWNGPEGFEAEGVQIEDLFTGDYSYEVSDVDGCSVNGTEFVDEPEPLVVSTTPTATSCTDLCDGSILVDVQGGVQPWAIVLDILPVNNQIEDLCAGAYLLTVQDAQGCERVTTVMVGPGVGTVSPELSGPTALCADADAVQLTATPAGGTWSGPGVSADGVFDPMIAGPAAHVLTYSLTCAAPTNITVEVFHVPLARFLLPMDDGMVVQNTSAAATTYRWWVNDVFSGDKDDLTLSSPTIGADAPVVICLAAFNTWGCSDTTCTVFARPVEPSVYVPNAFTPNEDELNEEFLVYGAEAGSFEMVLFDRWGEEIYRTVDPYKYWDGTSGGKPVPDGVYIYTVTYQDRCNANSTLVTTRGHVTVLR
jgi:gliding motility-associated-like protein